MPDRRPYIAGNWKLWGTRAQAADYCERLLGPAARRQLSGRPTSASAFRTRRSTRWSTALDGSGVIVCAQNMHAEETGAFTGEISAPMLARAGRARRPARAIPSGASTTARPIARSRTRSRRRLDAGLAPILCVGETEEEREAGDTERKLRHQVQRGPAAGPRRAAGRGHDRVRADLGGRHRQGGHPGAGAGGDRVRPRAGGRPLRGGGGRGSGSVRRQRQA